MKKHILIAVSLALVLALILPFGVFAAAPTLINPGFETGDLTGWTTVVPSGGFVSVETSYMTGYISYNAISGTYFALLKTDGPGSYTTISQTFSANAGDTIEGWAFFYTDELGGYYDDNCKVEIKDSGDVVKATPFEASASSTGRTGWTARRYTLAAAGDYKLEAKVANVGNSSFDSYMGLDMEPVTNTFMIDKQLWGWTDTAIMMVISRLERSVGSVYRSLFKIVQEQTSKIS